MRDRVIIVIVLSSLLVQSSSSQCSRLVLTPHREAPASPGIDAAQSFTKSCTKGRTRNENISGFIKYEGFGKKRTMIDDLIHFHC